MRAASSSPDTEWVVTCNTCRECASTGKSQVHWANNGVHTACNPYVLNCGITACLSRCHASCSTGGPSPLSSDVNRCIAMLLYHSRPSHSFVRITTSKAVLLRHMDLSACKHGVRVLITTEGMTKNYCHVISRSSCAVLTSAGLTASH